MKTAYVLAALVVLTLSGCSAAVDADTVEEPAASSQRQAPAEVVETPAPVPTGAGEICDINSMNTVECSKQFPEVAYLNAITRGGSEPLISMTDADKIQLGEAACVQLRAGTPSESVSVIDGESIAAGLTNNQIVAGAAVPNYCVELDTSGLF